MIRKLLLVLLACLCYSFCRAQTDTIVFSKYTTVQARSTTLANIVQFSIEKNLVPLTDSTEEHWEDAMAAMVYIQLRSPLTDGKINAAAKQLQRRSTDFQRGFLEMLYTLYPLKYNKEVLQLLSRTGNTKIFAMCAEYLVLSREKNNYRAVIQANIKNRFGKDSTGIIDALQKSLGKTSLAYIRQLNKAFHFNDIFDQQYLLHNTVVYSLQSSNRNYPGLVIIKDTAGNFMTTAGGGLLTIGQLGRSNSNMPGYLTNGNTPQGLYRLYGFDVSKSMAIGPTQNIQLTMPYETTVPHFLKDSSIKDSNWSPALYKSLLPQSWQNFEPAMGSFYASKIGRTEIIAHGTTVDPGYYEGQPYYPYTPTQGCLCTKEIWDAYGKRAVSDQQKLVNAVKKAGGADGYLIVVEIGDLQRAVTINDVLPLLKN